MQTLNVCYVSLNIYFFHTNFSKIMLPILKYPANNGFRELFQRHNGVSFLTNFMKVQNLK